MHKNKEIKNTYLKVFNPLKRVAPTPSCVSLYFSVPSFISPIFNIRDGPKAEILNANFLNFGVSESKDLIQTGYKYPLV